MILTSLEEEDEENQKTLRSIELKKLAEQLKEVGKLHIENRWPVMECHFGLYFLNRKKIKILGLMIYSAMFIAQHSVGKLLGILMTGA